MILKSSTTYNNEKDGIAIKNKMMHGNKVHIISKFVLCWTREGNS